MVRSLASLAMIMSEQFLRRWLSASAIVGRLISVGESVVQNFRDHRQVGECSGGAERRVEIVQIKPQSNPASNENSEADVEIQKNIQVGGTYVFVSHGCGVV